MSEPAKVIQLYADPNETTQKVQNQDESSMATASVTSTSIASINKDDEEIIENLLRAIIVEEKFIKAPITERDENDVRYLNEDDFILEKVSKEKIRKIKFHANKISKYAKELNLTEEDD